MDVESGVREFIENNISLRDEKGALSSDESLLDSGLIDSAGLFELVAFLEERFGVVIADEELVPENFETIDAIVALVATKSE